MYVKWFDTVMFYYVILVNVTFCHFFKFPAVPSPYIPTSQGTELRRQIPASAGGHYRGHCRRDIAGAQDKVREEQIPEQRRMVFPSVARG
ncbi:unnamed protein product [Staurois parvus]|uniref:Secreted protein n=1 Tax=Staurois parvus TaxID=386267 RepID=A0ABN9CIZ3_9NEOB|nr:unnamed protein product [Staurois parvus]